MAKYNNQKAKILFLQQMLYETGENRTVTMQEILDYLLQKGIRAERKSIYDDMEVLRYFGMDIQYKRDRPSGYYFAGWLEGTGTVVKRPESLPSPAVMEPAEPVGRAEQTSEAAVVAAEPVKEKEPETEVREKGQKKEKEKELPGYQRFLVPQEIDDSKQMKLLCSEEGAAAARAYFGDKAQYKERDYGEVAVTAPAMDGSNFYGWLTAVGPEVHMQKPKKTIQAYREYLKMLAKEYKIEK